MRVAIMTLMCLALIRTAHAEASEPPAGATEIVLSPATLTGQVSGTTAPEKPVTFYLRASTRRDITIKLVADNGPCGFEMRRGSSLGFQNGISQFPAQRTFNAQEGEIFIFSFFQTRAAFMERKGCSYSLSVN